MGKKNTEKSANTTLIHIYQYTNEISLRTLRTCTLNKKDTIKPRKGHHSLA